ncbi:MAG: hypothetical protein JWO02_4782 [Solirubrobacterales bacterium]|nr:hypothetical protein [Solirubrobacterales bacterium]
MPRTRRSRVIPADPSAVWGVVGDPHNLSRWWPRVERVEQVTAGAFTEVLRSDRGRTIRADHRLSELKENERIEWTQLLEGTPFARVMSEGVTGVTLEPANGGQATKVTLERRQRMSGMARFGGGFMIRRATSKVLDGALDALTVAVVTPA